MKQQWMVLFLALMLGTGIPVMTVQAQMFVFENPLVGTQAPDFTLKNLSGKDVNYKKAAEGKNSILFFWATWCPHCRTAIKTFNGRMEEFRSRGVELVVVDVGEDFKKVESYMKRNKLEIDVLLDEGSVVSEEYALIGFPTFVFVDKDGKVRDVQHELPEDYEEIFK